MISREGDILGLPEIEELTSCYLNAFLFPVIFITGEIGRFSYSSYFRYCAFLSKSIVLYPYNRQTSLLKTTNKL